MGTILNFIHSFCFPSLSFRLFIFSLVHLGTPSPVICALDVFPPRVIYTSGWQGTRCVYPVQQCYPVAGRLDLSVCRKEDGSARMDPGMRVVLRFTGICADVVNGWVTRSCYPTMNHKDMYRCCERLDHTKLISNYESQGCSCERLDYTRCYPIMNHCGRSDER